MIAENIINQFINKLKDYINYIIILAIFLLVISFFRNVIKIKSADEKIGEAEDKVVKLEDVNSSLRDEIERVATEQYVEKQLRDNLGLAKEGEIVVVLPEDEVLRKLAPKHEIEEETLPDPNWKKWLNLFF